MALYAEEPSPPPLSEAPPPVPVVAVPPVAPPLPVGEAPPVPPPITNPLPEVPAAPSNQIQAESEPPPGEMLNLGLRFDGSFFAGNGGVEGFSLPSYRVSLFGKVAPRIRYRMSLGQAREFSSAFLPQIVPVEAFAVFAAGDPKRPTGTATAGLFAPAVNPWWTPDLTDLPLPDYAAIHRAMFLSRELGVELSVAAIPRVLEASIAFVNGTGIFGSQSGSTRAVTAMVRSGFATSDFRVMLGAGGYYFSIGSSGTPQYRSQYVADAFVQLRIPRWGVTVGGDAIFGWYTDAFRSLRPTGGQIFALVEISDQLEAFARYELLDHWWGDTPSFRNLDAGPVLKIAKGTKLFLLFKNRQVASASDSGGEARVRLQL